MKPVIALIGRPNVGKSSLFNRLTKTRDAIVVDQPGVTRDRRYGQAKYNDHEFIIIDTGGIMLEGEGIDEQVSNIALQAIDESDLALFMVDGKQGLTAEDQEVADKIRVLGKKLMLIVNKTERMDKSIAGSEFYAMGIGQPYCISASHGEGVPLLFEEIAGRFDFPERTQDLEEQSADQRMDQPRVAIVGRPNVGKSTLVNRLIGEERVLAFDQPGTTRDSIEVPFEFDGDTYTLIDTAGVRRKARVNETVEKFSIVKTLQAIDNCNVVILVLDAQQGISSQDAHLLGYIVDSGKGLLIAINKWDGLAPDERERVKSEIDRKINFIDYASIHYISALHGSGVGHLMSIVRQCYRTSFSEFSTPELTRILEDAIAQHQPPMAHGRRIKLRYAHQGGKNPPRIIIHGNQTDSVPDSYRRYLANQFRRVLKLEGVPVHLGFKTGENPYKNKRNKLTPRQERSRKRMIRHVKRK